MIPTTPTTPTTPMVIPSTTSSRMENSSVIDISKPTGKESPSRLRRLPRFFLKSLGPLKTPSSRQLSDTTASTVASDLSEYEEVNHDIVPGEVLGAHISDEWDCEDFSSHHVMVEEQEYDTDDDEYLIPLSDAPTRNRLFDETRTSPKRREILMDDFEQKIRREILMDDFERKIWKERFVSVCDGSHADSTTDEGCEEQDYDVPLWDTPTRSRLLDEA
jgi:hypothetical protein